MKTLQLDKLGVLVVIIFAVNLLACHRDAEDDATCSLIGQWKWEKSVGGIGGQIIVADHTRILTFYADSTCTIDEAQNNYERFPFRVTTVTDITTQKPAAAIVYYDEAGPNGTKHIYSCTDDNRLILWDNVADGFTHFYLAYDR